MLEWRQIEVEKNRILVDRALKTRNGIEIGLPKWGKIRNVPMPASVADALKTIRPEASRFRTDLLLFPYADGSIRQFGWWYGAFHRAMKNLKIDTVARNISGHSLRHGANTRLIERGVDPAIVRAVMGHASEAVSATYTHHRDMQLDEVAAAEMDRIGEKSS